MVCADFAEVLPERMVVGILREQQSGLMSALPENFDPEKVMDLTFEPNRAAKDITKRRRDLVMTA